jgi:hypothetical protein
MDWSNLEKSLGYVPTRELVLSLPAKIDNTIKKNFMKPITPAAVEKIKPVVEQHVKEVFKLFKETPKP